MEINVSSKDEFTPMRGDRHQTIQDFIFQKWRARGKWCYIFPRTPVELSLAAEIAMHVVWKRPDGFHGSKPSDFDAVSVGGRANLWLHKKDHEHFPFRVSGDWKEDEASKKLNRLINLFGQPRESWVSHLNGLYAHGNFDDSKSFVTDLDAWLHRLQDHLKGDTWEVEIMNQTLLELRQQITTLAGEIK
jgi:hypothetical protein